MNNQPTGIVILGAGLQGSCIALELARQGHEIVLLDLDPVPMNRASLRNEGKIHLGLTYANDPTMATGGLQLEGALQFRRLLHRWIGDRADALPLSTPFHYLVAKDSVLTPEELQRHYEALQSLYLRRLDEEPELDYLGERPEKLTTRADMAHVSQYFLAGHFQAVFETAERAIDTLRLAEFIRDAIGTHPNIRFLPSHSVAAVERRNEHFDIHGTNSHGPFKISAQQVVNATWQSRMAIDRTAGVENSPGWLHRLKYRIIARLPSDLHRAPSATMVLGRYGDVVVRSDGTACLSWYPAGLRGWSHDLQPPPEWNPVCRGAPDPDVARELTKESLSAIDVWFPGIAQATPLIVDAGAIVAHGRTDVDDPQSGLHARSRVGVTSREGYHSVDPGKLTTAPLFAMVAAARVMNVHARADT